MKYFAALFALFFATSAQAAPVSVEFMARVSRLDLVYITHIPGFPSSILPGDADTAKSAHYAALMDGQWRKVAIWLSDTSTYSSPVTLSIGELEFTGGRLMTKMDDSPRGLGVFHLFYDSISFGEDHFFISEDQLIDVEHDGQRYAALGGMYRFEVAPMPVALPASAGALLAGIGALAMMRRRRQR